MIVKVRKNNCGGKTEKRSQNLNKGNAVAERSAKAKMSDYQGAMKFVSDKLGAEILKLK